MHPTNKFKGITGGDKVLLTADDELFVNGEKVETDPNSTMPEKFVMEMLIDPCPGKEPNMENFKRVFGDPDV